MTSTVAGPDEHSWQLIRRTAEGDADAFGEFYDLYVRHVYGYVFSLVRSRQAAESLTSDTFFRALRAAPFVRPDELTTPRAWLISIALKAVREHHRVA